VLPRLGSGARRDRELRAACFWPNLFARRCEDPAWYKNHSGEVGAWAEASLIVLSFTPSSAAAGRVFSLLKALFGSNQDMALADYIQGSMMVRYSGMKRGTSF